MSLSRLGRSSVASPLGAVTDGADDTRTLIVRAFSPVVAIYASEDTNELARRKGFQQGFAQMVKPFGERITGKVVVRDSVGASRAWDDFGVYLLDLGQIAQQAARPVAISSERLEELLDRYVEDSVDETAEHVTRTGEISPYYQVFLSRLLSTKQVSPHEAFVHPVACVIAISSSEPTPIERLRQLYSQTAQGNRALPPYANPEYLRYYVLVHDEDHDDFAKSSALFDQMKRHFGLHCHLLRIRSEVCLPSDDGAVEVPTCEWLSPVEDLGRLEETNNLLDDVNASQPHLHDSDIQSIKAFVRELTAQSVIPHMESRIALWNDQIASRRRGISGRFISLSKRWGGLSLPTSRSATPAPNQAPAGQSGNYDSLNGTYRYDTSEALLRKLADFAFMLRDYKLAASTYELLRTDFANDKAWKYLAGANEMCMAATLLNPLGATAKTFRVETFDQMIETSSYSYLTRCEDPGATLRAILLGVELLKVRGKAASEIASKWAIRVLEMGLVSPGGAGHVLVSERVASCFAGQVGSGSIGTRKRKAALWSVMAADEWLKLGKAGLAGEKLEEAARWDEESKMRKDNEANQGHDFADMSEFISQLQLAVKMKLGQARRRGASEAERRQMDIEDAEQEQDVHVETMTGQVEHLDVGRGHGHRKTLSSAVNPLEVAMALAPLSPARTRQDPLIDRDDDFE
jgi:trafficking protein particle complex subunit 8